MQVNLTEWHSFYSKFGEKTGLDLHKYREGQLQRRIISMAESKHATSLQEFWNWLSQSQANFQWFHDRLAINVSELFRNPEKWNELKTKLLPELIANSRTLKCWSAGCSYGAEAHSLATLFAAEFPGNHKIIGSDIDHAALAQAKTGTFSADDMRAMPKEYQDRYFTRSGEGWQASQVVRQYCSFREANILEKPFDSGFDLILCRNVVIYFTDPAKDELYERFFQVLKPGGILFVGGTERVQKSREIGFKSSIPFFYQKPINGDKVWQNAS